MRRDAVNGPPINSVLNEDLTSVLPALRHGDPQQMAQDPLQAARDAPCGHPLLQDAANRTP
eukprot:5919844-Lingulodinium_polyedra.AAC.1